MATSETVTRAMAGLTGGNGYSFARTGNNGGAGMVDIVDKIMGWPAGDRQTMMYGPPNNMRNTTMPEDDFAADLRTEAFLRSYAGEQNPRISSIISETVSAKHTIPSTRWLPRKPMPPSGSEEYHTFTFDKHNLDNVPEFGVVRNVTSRLSSFRVNYGRNGLGFTIPGEGALDRFGVILYSGHVNQISNAVQRHLDLSVYYQLLNTITTSINKKSWSALFGMRDAMATFQALMRHAFRFWAIFNKHQTGWRQVVAHIKEVLARNNVTPDTLVIPFNTKTQLALSVPMYQDYSKTGPLAVQNLSSIDGEQIFKAEGMTVDESQLYKIGDRGQIMEDPLVRVRVMGEHFVNKYSWHRGSEKYSSRYRDLYIHDNGPDVFKLIPLLDQVRYSGLFDPNTGAPSETWGKPFFSGSGNSILSYLDDVQCRDGVVRGITRATSDPKVDSDWKKTVERCKLTEHKTENGPLIRPTASKAPNKTGHSGRFGSSWDDDSGYDTSAVSVSSSSSGPSVVTLYLAKVPEDGSDADIKAATDNAAAQKAVAGILRNYNRNVGFSYTDLNTLIELVTSMSDAEMNGQAWVRVVQREFAIYPNGDSRNRVNQIRAYQQFIEHGRPTFIVDSFLSKLYRRHEHSHSIHRMSVYRSYAKRDYSEYKFLDARIPSFWDAAMQYTEEKKATDARNKLRSVAHALNMYLISRADHDGNKYVSKDWNARKDDGKDTIEGMLDAMSRGPAKSSDMDKIFGSESPLVKNSSDLTTSIHKAAELYCEGKAVPTDANYAKVTGLFVGDIPTTKDGNAVEVDLSQMRVHWYFFEFCIKYDIPFALDFKIFRPWMEYDMAAVMGFLSGLDTGSCSYGGATFWFGGDVTRKILYGNFTCRLGAVVKRPENVYVLPNASNKGYRNRGGGTKFFDPLNPQHIKHVQNNNRIADMFCVPMKPNEWNDDFAEISDMTGRYPNDFNLRLHDKELRNQYSMCSVFEKTYRISHPPGYLGLDYFDDVNEIRTAPANTLTAQATQYMPGPGLNGYLDERRCCVPGKGHWGPNVYDGVCKDRQGDGNMFVKEVDFKHNMIFT